ncbi:MAG: cytochrome b/b6 domain-containing protein [Blastocatellia bacterium]
MDELLRTPEQTSTAQHTRWVRLSHWIGTIGFMTLVFTGVVILMCHPRLYWGETGNNLTPALIELPISRNHQHGGWENSAPFYPDRASPITANRNFRTFNMNSWGRSLHFLAAWVLVLTGAFYLLAGFITGHFRRHFAPGPAELGPRQFWRELKEHARLRIRAATGGPQYGLLQKCAYSGIVFLALPLAVITGLTMSPAITAAYPFLLSLSGGFQSARTIHFFAFVALTLFLLAHIFMVIKSGFKRQIRGMILGGKHENE